MEPLRRPYALRERGGKKPNSFVSSAIFYGGLSVMTGRDLTTDAATTRSRSISSIRSVGGNGVHTYTSDAHSCIPTELSTYATVARISRHMPTHAKRRTVRPIRYRIIDATPWRNPSVNGKFVCTMYYREIGETCIGR